MRERFWLVRLYLCASVLLAIGIGWTDPDSQHYINGLNYESFNGRFASISLAFCATWGVIDTIGNIAGANTWTFRQLRRWRYVWLMGMVIGMASLVHQNIQSGYVMSVSLRYALDAMFALAIACLDPWTRPR